MRRKRGLRINVQKNTWNDHVIHIITLLTISIISHFPFVLKGIGEPDSARIAVVVIDRISHGPDGSLAGYYFTDTVPIYIYYLAWLVKSFELQYKSLPLIMNYTNAFFAILTIIPAYLLVRKLFNNNLLAFCSVFALIFNPSFFQASIYGTPHLIAFFFFLVSLYCYILWLDTKKSVEGYILLVLSSVSISVTILLKSPFAIGGGIYLGFLYFRRIKEPDKIIISLLSLTAAFLLFLLIRRGIVGAVYTGTTSVGNFHEWLMNYFGNLDKYTFGFIKRQLKPPIYGVGIFTAFLGIITFIYFIFRKRIDVLVFVLSWAAPTYLFWLFIYGNNARHFMLGVFPIIIMVVLFFYETVPKATIILTAALIIGNYSIIAPSSSTYFPSGNLYKSQALLQDRTSLYHSKAKKIADINEEKIAVMGRYHNPYVLYELLSSSPAYEARLLTSVKSAVVQVIKDHKEFMLCYIPSDAPEKNIEATIKRYKLDDYLIVSATDNLQWIKSRGIKVRNLDRLYYEYP